MSYAVFFGLSFSNAHRIVFCLKNGGGGGDTQFPISFSRDKAAGAWRPLNPSSSEVNALSYTSTPPYVFTAWCLVKYRGNFILPWKLNLFIDEKLCFIDEL
jgi:hypothetical protein